MNGQTFIFWTHNQNQQKIRSYREKRFKSTSMSCMISIIFDKFSTAQIRGMWFLPRKSVLLIEILKKPTLYPNCKNRYIFLLYYLFVRWLDYYFVTIIDTWLMMRRCSLKRQDDTLFHFLREYVKMTKKAWIGELIFDYEFWIWLLMVFYVCVPEIFKNFNIN